MCWLSVDRRTGLIGRTTSMTSILTAVLHCTKVNWTFVWTRVSINNKQFVVLRCCWFMLICRNIIFNQAVEIYTIKSNCILVIFVLRKTTIYTLSRVVPNKKNCFCTTTCSIDIFWLSRSHILLPVEQLMPPHEIHIGLPNVLYSLL